jgi:hypothetical protein
MTIDEFAAGDRVRIFDGYPGRVLWVDEMYVRVAYGEMPGHPHRRVYTHALPRDIELVAQDPSWNPFDTPADLEATDRVFRPRFKILFRYAVGDPVWLPDHITKTESPATITDKRQAWTDLSGVDGRSLGRFQSHMLLPVSGHWPVVR